MRLFVLYLYLTESLPMPNEWPSRKSRWRLLSAGTSTRLPKGWIGAQWESWD